MRYCRKPAGAVSCCLCRAMEAMQSLLAVRQSRAIQIATRLLSTSAWLPLHARRWFVCVSIRHERRLSITSCGRCQWSRLRRPCSTRPCRWWSRCFVTSTGYSALPYVVTESLRTLYFLPYIYFNLSSLTSSICGNLPVSLMLFLTFYVGTAISCIVKSALQ